MGQYEAGVHAQTILDKIMSRSDMSQVIEQANGKWINGRKKIGSYALGLMENANFNDPEVGYKFELGMNEFINTMNESYHVRGYYIDSTGKTQGDIYVCEECEPDYPYMINKNDDDAAYVAQEAAWQDYLVNKARLERKMRVAVSEALIITNEQLVDKVDRLIALQEGIGDTLSDAWTKFKNFLAKLWQKFTEFISRTLNNDKSYLTKYKEIILNRDVTIDEVTLENNYTQGEKNITQFVIYTPSSADINGFPNKNEGDNIKQVQDKVFPQYASNHNLDFAEFCLKYFKGNGNETRLASEHIKTMMPSMFNWCYNFDKIEKKINRDRATYDKAFRAFESVAKDVDAKTKAASAAAARANDKVGMTQSAYSSKEDADKALQSANKAVEDAEKTKTTAEGELAKDPNDPTKKKAVEDAKSTLKTAQDKLSATKRDIEQFKLASMRQDQKTQADKLKPTDTTVVQTSSAILTTLGIPIVEADAVIGSSKKSAVGNKSVGTASKAGNLNLDVSSVRTKDAGDTGALVDHTDAEGLNTKFSMFCTSSQQVFSSLLQAAQTINKQYMRIIKAHVQSYAGNMEDSAKTAMGTAANHSQNFRFDSNSVIVFSNIIKQIEAMPQSSEQEQEARNAATINLLTRANMAANGQRSFTTLDELKNFLAAHNQPAQGAQPANPVTVPPKQPPNSVNATLSGGQTQTPTP